MREGLVFVNMLNAEEIEPHNSDSTLKDVNKERDNS